MSATAADVLATARSQIGTREQPPGSNRTPYGAAYGSDGQAWCAKFVWWVFRQSLASQLIPKAAYTPAFAEWFKRHNQWGTTPRPGAVPAGVSVVVVIAVLTPRAAGARGRRR